jgi:hypothetical protein
MGENSPNLVTLSWKLRARKVFEQQNSVLQKCTSHGRRNERFSNQKSDENQNFADSMQKSHADTRCRFAIITLYATCLALLRHTTKKKFSFKIFWHFSKAKVTVPTLAEIVRYVIVSARW